MLLLAIGSYLAYTKDLPFVGGGNEVKATFQNATTLRTTSPVRIAGVNVGKVTAVEAEGDAAEVTFTVKDEGLPIHEDATVDDPAPALPGGQLLHRPAAGQPERARAGGGGEIPVTQTSTSVQLDEVLSALQTDTRDEPQGAPRGIRDGALATSRPLRTTWTRTRVQGKTRAQALNDSLPLRRRGGPRHGDRQRGAAGRREPTTSRA